MQWEEAELSGVKWRQVAVPRGYHYAVDEARARTALEGLVDEREDVLASWREAGSWLRAPVLVSGEVTRSLFEYELLVGFTRLGDLLGLLDRQEIPEYSMHRVWLGSLRDT